MEKELLDNWIKEVKVRLRKDFPKGRIRIATGTFGDQPMVLASVDNYRRALPLMIRFLYGEDGYLVTEEKGCSTRITS